MHAGQSSCCVSHILPSVRTRQLISCRPSRSTLTRPSVDTLPYPPHSLICSILHLFAVLMYSRNPAHSSAHHASLQQQVPIALNLRRARGQRYWRRYDMHAIVPHRPSPSSTRMSPDPKNIIRRLRQTCNRSLHITIRCAWSTVMVVLSLPCTMYCKGMV